MSDRTKRRIAIPGFAALAIGVCGGGFWGILLIAIGLFVIVLLCRESDGEFHLVGPFAWRELVRSARGTHRHFWRTIYVLISFSALILFHLDGQANGLTTWTPAAYKQLTQANEYFFNLYAVALLILVPSLAMHWASELILEERNAKRWDILRTTQLTSHEIVLGKMFGRLPVVFDPITATLPVLAMMTLIGGLSPLLMMQCLAGVLVTTLGMTGVTLFYATFASKPGQAAGSAIGIFILYIVVSATFRLIEVRMPATWNRGLFYGWTIADLVELLQSGNPMVQIPLAAMVGLENGLAERLPRYAAFHLFLGLIFGSVAILRLRTAQPWDAKTATDQAIKTVAKSMGKSIHRPPVDDEPVAWWERHGHHTAAQHLVWKGLGRWINPWLICMVIVGCLLIRVVFFKMNRDAVEVAGPIVTFFAWIFSWPPIMGAMTRGAKSIPRERASDTLDALRITALTPREILVQKWKGVCTAELPACSLGLAVLIGGTLTGFISPFVAVPFVLSVIVFTMAGGAWGLSMGIDQDNPEKAARTLFWILIPMTFVVSLMAWPPMIAGFWLAIPYQRSKEWIFMISITLIGMAVWSAIGLLSWKSINRRFK